MIHTEAALIAVIHFDGNHTATYDYPSYGFNFDWMTNLNKFAMDSVVNETKDRVVDSLGYPTDLNWHDFQFRYYNQNLQIVYDDSVALDGTHSESYSTTYIGLASREKYDSNPSSNTYFDDVFVRKYVSPEPGVVIGTEELNP